MQANPAAGPGGLRRYGTPSPALLADRLLAFLVPSDGAVSDSSGARVQLGSESVLSA